MLVETAVRMKFFQTTATHEPQKLMSGHIMEEHIINITSSKIERERERERERKKKNNTLPEPGPPGQMLQLQRSPVF